MKILVAAAFLAGTARPVCGATNYVAYGGASLTFRPSSLTIVAGDTVIWTNASGIHNVVGDPPGPPLCGCTTNIASWTNVFTVPGDYSYHCFFHQNFGMTGIVQVASGLAPTLVAPMNFTNGFVFEVTNTAFHTNIVQASSDLSQATGWISLATNFPPTNTFNFIDPNAVTISNRFYRVFQP